MKILFVGTLISQNEMERLNAIAKRKASVAPNNYETMFVNGLAENGAQIEVCSIPAVAAYPGNPTINFKLKEEILNDCETTIQWIPFINIQGLKQITIQINTYRMVKKWLKKNLGVKEKIIISYSIYPPYTKPLVDLCRKYHCKLVAVIADLPEYMYTWGRKNPVTKFLGNEMKNRMLRLQNQCDSYILFTEKMAWRMKIQDKPYLVSEGFSDGSIFQGIAAEAKTNKRILIYAGNLSRLYGIQLLCRGFMKTKGNQELHLYGSGEDVEFIKECAQKDARIKYFGQVKREEVLKAIVNADIIVINKPTSDDYSNYSFSSKILECMTSGTPILTTRVGGMPKEYYPFFYFIDNESEDGICNSIEETINLPEEELKIKGKKAADFANNHKNYLVSTKRVLEFLEQNK